MTRVRLSKLPRLFDAQAIAVTASLILLVPDRADDQPLIEHERVHCRQIEKAGGAVRFWIRYWRDRDYREACEIEAYRVQIALQPVGLRALRLEQYARRLAQPGWRGYRLGISVDRARELLAS